MSRKNAPPLSSLSPDARRGTPSGSAKETLQNRAMMRTGSRTPPISRSAVDLAPIGEESQSSGSNQEQKAVPPLGARVSGQGLQGAIQKMEIERESSKMTPSIGGGSSSHPSAFASSHRTGGTPPAGRRGKLQRIGRGASPSPRGVIARFRNSRGSDQSTGSYSAQSDHASSIVTPGRSDMPDGANDPACEQTAIGTQGRTSERENVCARGVKGERTHVVDGSLFDESFSIATDSISTYSGIVTGTILLACSAICVYLARSELKLGDAFLAEAAAFGFCVCALLLLLFSMVLFLRLSAPESIRIARVDGFWSVSLFRRGTAPTIRRILDMEAFVETFGCCSHLRAREWRRVSVGWTTSRFGTCHLYFSGTESGRALSMNASLKEPLAFFTKLRDVMIATSHGLADCTADYVADWEQETVVSGASQAPEGRSWQLSNDGSQSQWTQSQISSQYRTMDEEELKKLLIGLWRRESNDVAMRLVEDNGNLYIKWDVRYQYEPSPVTFQEGQVTMEFAGSVHQAHWDCYSSPQRLAWPDGDVWYKARD